MNILLEAYLDRNFGDDLFVTLLTDHYKEHQFYLMDNDSRGFSLVNCNKYGNLHTLTEEDALVQIEKFHAYVLVGGDFYPPYYSRYKGRVERAKGIHKNGGSVLVLGASLYREYPEDSLPAVREFFRQVDAVTFRDGQSYAKYKEILPVSCSFLSSDMMFTLAEKLPVCAKEGSEIRVLGISIRSVMNASDEQYEAYCQSIAQLVSAYLNQKAENQVQFLAFSTGDYDDRDTADRIIEMVPRSLKERIEVAEYSRDVFTFIDRINLCDALVCTRFHSLCTALLLGKPFFPINYEAKVENLLKEIGYTGESAAYGGKMEPEAVMETLEKVCFDQDKLRIYMERAKHFFDASDIFLNDGALPNAGNEMLIQIMRQLYAEREENNELHEHLIALEKERQETLAAAESEKHFLEEKNEKLKKEHQETLAAAESEKHFLEEKNEKLKKEHQETLAAAESEKHFLKEKNEKLEKENKEYKEALEAAKDEKRFLEEVNAKLAEQMRDQQEQVGGVVQLCKDLAATKMFKLVHLGTRVRHQMFSGSREQRKDFRKWVKGRLQHKPDFNHSYNPMFSLIAPLQQVCMNLNAETLSSQPIQKLQDQKHSAQGNIALAPITADILQKEYSKTDIIIFSVIDYDFRFQRPQHFAKRFSENGHRVFYINANFVNPECIKEISPNLYTVSFKTDACNAIYFNDQWKGFDEWITGEMESLLDTYAIRDAILILDYPNWIDVSETLRSRYGFGMVADYMDDATGFLGTTTDSLKVNCERMLRDCDLVVPSSQFLADIARKYTDKTAIVRNGTEVEHFFKAREMEHRHERPVIGYYGAVSHWFDWEKVCYVAKNLPHCDIVIIGEVTEYRDKLEKYENIKLLGEMNYRKLPEHLAYFDVCLIPFETSTDLIKATNPVKFYEYLSAGKRVVATEIPELEPYRDQYVYMANDNRQFLEYVKLCLAGEDTLASKEDCIAFAKENSWQKRYEAFAQACVKAVPKVSVIVLTYNNLRLNQYCVNSVLDHTAYPNFELIILDNQSTDGTVEYLRELDAKKDPRVRVILNPENNGFAGGNNKAIKQADGKYIVLLNNDTVVTRGWLTSLVKHMEADPECGMVGAVTNSIGNEQMIAVQYHNLRELADFAYSYTRKHMGEVYRGVDRIPLFCTMIRKEMMDQYGLLDDGYRVGMFEDDDYAMLVKKAGYHFFAAEDCFIHHVNNASFKKLHPEEYKKIFNENRARFEKKWNTTWKMPKYRADVTPDVNQGCMVEPIE